MMRFFRRLPPAISLMARYLLFICHFEDDVAYAI